MTATIASAFLGPHSAPDAIAGLIVILALRAGRARALYGRNGRPDA